MISCVLRVQSRNLGRKWVKKELANVMIQYLRFSFGVNDNTTVWDSYFYRISIIIESIQHPWLLNDNLATLSGGIFIARSLI